LFEELKEKYEGHKGMDDEKTIKTSKSRVKIGDYTCKTCDKFFNTADKRKKH
jgi:hypothetical protein